MKSTLRKMPPFLMMLLLISCAGTPAPVVDCPLWVKRHPPLADGAVLIVREAGHPDRLAREWIDFANTLDDDMDANCNRR